MIQGFGGKAPKIAPSAFVSEAACIFGDVEIGENSSIWPGAVIRGDFFKVRIGNSTAVEDNCIIHAGMSDLEIGDEVHIGHGAVIDCRRIGNRVLVGMNSTILHGAEIGDGCVIAAGSLVSQGMKVPDNSFVVGVPGRIKGGVSSKQSWWAQSGSQVYASLARQYREQGL